MKARVEAGTDVAKIGAWDTSRENTTFDKLSFKQTIQALSEDAKAGWIFVLNTGSDGGGPLDVYVDEPVPENVAKNGEFLKGEFLIRVPTGKLVVGGVEDYRSPRKRITGPESVITVPNGNYRIRCFAPNDEEESFSVELKKAVGADDYDYWRKKEKTGLYGYLLFALFPFLAYVFNWKIALAISVGLAVIYFCCREKILKRNARYQRIEAGVQEVYRQAKANSPPTFIFELKRLEDGSELKGGEVDFV